ncbi:hypothetical protein LTR17_007382 [Elasticomyces elasticus]|nr:hypothetical protein LTR17_007382 [Elasticomyces elasticus]
MSSMALSAILMFTPFRWLPRMIELLTGHDEKVDRITSKLRRGRPLPQLYDNLSAGQFRLLRLFATEKDDAIRCCLQTFTAGSPDCPSYRAVSYTWGPKSSTIKPISISSQGNPLHEEPTDERRSLHSQNLFDLLNQLRSEQSDCWLWIDALCINQDDADERSHQVKIMGDIFRAANTVLVWLGPFTHSEADPYRDTTGVGLDVVHMIQRDHHRDVRSLYIGDYAHTAMNLVKGRGICALPYWRRRWIVQELLLARSVVLQVREKQFTMTALEGAVHYANESNGDTSVPQHARFGSIKHTAGVQLALHSLRVRTGMASPRLLKELLVMYKDQECQQPYDLVYAMHSLIDPKHRDHLQVDYNQSAEEYFYVVISFMHEHEDLGIEGVRIAWLLLRVIDPSLIDAFRMPFHGAGLFRPFDMEGHVFKLGSRPEQLKESGLSIGVRRNVAAMSPILPWRLQLKSASWTPEKRTRPNLASTVVSIGSQDMLFFTILGASKWGLAAMAEPQFSTEDEIWLFAHTSYAFIVLPDASGSMTVRGRAVLFNSDGTSYIGNELYPFPLPAAGNIKSTISCVKMRLTIPDLITLTTMANKAILD